MTNPAPFQPRDLRAEIARLGTVLLSSDPANNRVLKALTVEWLRTGEWPIDIQGLADRANQDPQIRKVGPDSWTPSRELTGSVLERLISGGLLEQTDRRGRRVVMPSHQLFAELREALGLKAVHDQRREER